jgi:hypothetical protein
MKKHNKYLRLIKNLFWELDDVSAVERFLKEYRYPGASLRLIARNLGVLEVLEERLPFDGAIFESGGQTVIKLNGLSPIRRQRFTLGHELGHLIFVQRFSIKRECMEDPELESACDHLAVELLMPRVETIEFVSKLGAPTPEKLKAVARRFGVSLHVAARRLQDLNVWNRSVGLWEHSGKPQQLWFVGKKLWNRPPNFTAFELAKASPVSVSTIESLPSGDYFGAIALQMLNLGRNFFLGLIRTSP